MAEISAAVLATLCLAAAPAEEIRLDKWFGHLTTLESIPNSCDIDCVTLSRPINWEQHRLGVADFKRLMGTAKPVEANSQLIRDWHYAPWYSGTFTVDKAVYSFDLYGGGLGRLRTPAGHTGMFRFETPDKKPREAGR